MPIEVRQTEEFAEWFTALRDRRAADRIAARLVRAQDGNLGDVKYFEGIGEMRIDHGPGYRLYFASRGTSIVILLCGGDKGSQRRDIGRAVRIAEKL